MRKVAYTIFEVGWISHPCRISDLTRSDLKFVSSVICCQKQEDPVVEAHTAEKRVWNGRCDAKRSSKRGTFRNAISAPDSLPALMSSSTVSESQNISLLQRMKINNPHDNESSAES